MLPKPNFIYTCERISFGTSLTLWTDVPLFDTPRQRHTLISGTPSVRRRENQQIFIGTVPVTRLADKRDR
jgi:hypothetical protein